jgi:glycosyltransferase involved in cell wall biosynthesis
MNILYIVLTYERPKITSICLNTLLNNSSVLPSELAIFDDGSSYEMQQKILSFANENKNSLNISTHFRNRNGGVGLAFEEAYELIKRRNPDISCF